VSLEEIPFSGIREFCQGSGRQRSTMGANRASTLGVHHLVASNPNRGTQQKKKMGSEAQRVAWLGHLRVRLARRSRCDDTGRPWGGPLPFHINQEGGFLKGYDKCSVSGHWPLEDYTLAQGGKGREEKNRIRRLEVNFKTKKRSSL